MTMDSNDQVLEAFRGVIESGDMVALIQFMTDTVSDDFVQVWPQSGERVEGRDRSAQLFEMIGAMSGEAPSMKLGRISGSGDAYVIEGTIDYGDGTPVNYVAIAEFREGKITRMTEYFANPFPAPEWRAHLVTMGEPATA